MLGQNQFHWAEPKPACFDFSSSNFHVQGSHTEHCWGWFEYPKESETECDKRFVTCLWTHRHSDPSLQALLFLALDLVLLDCFSKDGWLQRCTCSTSQRKAPRTCVTSRLDVLYRRKQIKWGRTKWKDLGLGFQCQEVGSDSSSSSSSSKRGPRKIPIIVVLFGDSRMSKQSLQQKLKERGCEGHHPEVLILGAGRMCEPAVKYLSDGQFITRQLENPHRHTIHVPVDVVLASLFLEDAEKVNLLH